MRSSFANYGQNNGTQVTFYFDNGDSESFNISEPPDIFGERLLQLLAQPVLTFHLTDQTVAICTAKVTKVEIKPTLTELQGEGIFANSHRVTTMQRSATGRLPIE